MKITLDVANLLDGVKMLTGDAQTVMGKLVQAKPLLSEVDLAGSFLGVEIYNEYMWAYLFRLVFNMTVILLIVRGIYYPLTKRKNYLFTYIMISLIAFIVCHAFQRLDMGLGMALGLFAIFGIIRYRTNAIPIKEMTYLFVVIGISVVNALADNKFSYAEMITTNGVVVGTIFLLEKVWLLRHEARKVINYDRIELVKPECHEELMQDLRARTGLDIHRFELGRINFLSDTTNIRVFFYTDKGASDQYEDFDF